MHHVHDIEPPSIGNDGERPDHGHQADEAITDKATCNVSVSMLNDTCVSIQPTKYMNKNWEHYNNNNAPSGISISIDPKRRNIQLTLLMKDEIPP